MDNLLINNALLIRIKENVQLEEEIGILEKILSYIHFSGITSTKELARLVLLPVPVVAAIKNEFIKAGILKRDARITVTSEGVQLLEEELGYKAIDKAFFIHLLSGKYDWQQEGADLYHTLDKLLAGRPRVDVTLDQSKGTTETILKRGLLALTAFQLIGKSILCLGDDDLVSVGLGFLFKTLFKTETLPVKIMVVDKDERFLKYIREIASAHQLPIVCYKHDLYSPLPGELCSQFHTVFTDPPYTLSGLTLFLSRAREGLIKAKEQVIFLSFAHKSPAFLLKMHQQILELGLVPVQIIPAFNKYEGAEIIGNQSQMLVLKTTSNMPLIKEDFKGDYTGLIYTGEIRRTVRTYQCRNCKRRIPVGQDESYPTIEQLKTTLCPYCKGDSFSIIEKINK